MCRQRLLLRRHRWMTQLSDDTHSQRHILRNRVVSYLPTHRRDISIRGNVIYATRDVALSAAACR